MKILITGVAGFIGMHVAKFLLDRGDEIIGIDNLNEYYDVSLKNSRLILLNKYKNFTFKKIDIASDEEVRAAFDGNAFDAVIHLAAQAGVRYSIENPGAYIQSNLVGFFNILEACKRGGVGHLVYASSSSVYGGNMKMPFSEGDMVDSPVSLYAATKKSNELMAHSYSHLYGLPTTGLRFFTVYGAWGRPDMAYYSFAKNIMDGVPIKIFNYGKMKRDFTYIDDIVKGVVACMDKRPDSGGLTREADSAAKAVVPYKVFNIGNNNPVDLGDFIETLEFHLGRAAVREYLPMQPGDVVATYADTDSLCDWIDFRPSVSLRDGIGEFSKWFLEYQI